MKLSGRLNAKPTRPHRTKKGKRGYDRRRDKRLISPERLDNEGGVLMNHNHRLRTELDAQELAALQRFMTALHEEPHASKPKIDVNRICRGVAGQILVPVTVSGTHPDVHLAMIMEHKAEQLYKQSACRFVLVQQLETDPERRSYVWGDGDWQSVP